jgi:heme exporter protein C
VIRRFANPTRFLALARVVTPLAAVLSALGFGFGLWLALVASPPDYQQEETVRIMYVHVPAAWMALFVYTSMAIAAITGFVWKHVVAELYAKAAAPVGAAFTLICLVTGALWGQPMWGTWWAWDARMTSVLVLFFLYLGYIALVDSFDDPQRGINAGAILLIVGLVNIPVIKFSVDWWNTLHQPASLTRLDTPAIDSAMLWPLLTMAFAFKMFFIALVCLRLQTEIMRRRLAVRHQQVAGEAT